MQGILLGTGIFLSLAIAGGVFALSFFLARFF